MNHPFTDLSQPYPDLIIDAYTARVWAQLDDDFEPELINGTLLRRQHHLVDRLIRDVGLLDVLDVRDGLWWALELGLTPWQPFLLEITVTPLVQDWGDGVEHDLDVDWELVRAEPVSLADAATALAEHLLVPYTRSADPVLAVLRQALGSRQSSACSRRA